MAAKLFIRGMKEPLDLSDEEGKVADALIADSARPKDTPFKIEGVFSGTKADMRFVVFEKKEAHKPSTAQIQAQEEEAYRQKMLRIPPDRRAYNCSGRFKMSWFTRSGMKEKEPPENVMLEFYALGTAHFKANPQSIDIPFEVYGPLLVKRFGAAQPSASQVLAKKMTVPPTKQ